MSFLLVEKTTNDLSGESSTFSTSNSPGVNAVSGPPSAEMENRCTHPSFSEGNSRRSPATHCQKSAPPKPENESASKSPERQTCLPSPPRAFTTQMAHG